MSIVTAQLIPSDQDVRDARETSKKLAEVETTEASACLHVFPKGSAEMTVTIPSPAMRLIRSILEEMGKGHDVVVTTSGSEVTTQQAADYLMVSRPYLISELLDKGKIPFRRVGNRRRVRTEDLAKYKRLEDAEIARRETVMLELMAESERIGLYR